MRRNTVSSRGRGSRPRTSGGDAPARGEKRVGRGKKAVFDAKTRDVQLTGLPSLDVDQHMFKALRENCVVVIKEDGNHRLIGPFDTLLTERKDNKKPGQP